MQSLSQNVECIVGAKPPIHRNEDGFLLVLTMAMLLVLTIIGISALTYTRLELQIAGNDLVHKETFFEADGGADLAAALIEESYGTEGLGYTKLSNVAGQGDFLQANGTILVVDRTLAENTGTRTKANISDALRDIAYYPVGYDGTVAGLTASPHTNIIVDGVVGLIPGEGSQSDAGYEGQGGGTFSKQGVHTIFSQHMGRRQSQSMVQIEWRHILGLTIEGHY